MTGQKCFFTAVAFPLFILWSFALPGENSSRSVPQHGPSKRERLGVEVCRRYSRGSRNCFAKKRKNLEPACLPRSMYEEVI